MSLNRKDFKTIVEITNYRRVFELKHFSFFATKSIDAIRNNPNKRRPDKDDVRSPYAHDADRIIHSIAYSRYIDKTQVFFLFDNDHLTHRVLHVQLVSKIARTIGRCLRLNEDLIEAISLGHDIGHTPFGHLGEKFLNNIAKENGWVFSHNAQSVRFLYELEEYEGRKGLNLSLQVYDGILSHCGENIQQKYTFNPNKTFDDFINEYNNCWLDEKFSKSIIPSTLEACVVKISDIIAYIGRDIQDAITVGLVKGNLDDFNDLSSYVRETLGKNNGEIINKLIMDIVINSYKKNYIAFSDNIYSAFDELYKPVYPVRKVNDEFNT